MLPPVITWAEVKEKQTCWSQTGSQQDFSWNSSDLPAGSPPDVFQTLKIELSFHVYNTAPFSSAAVSTVASSQHGDHSVRLGILQFPSVHFNNYYVLKHSQTWLMKFILLKTSALADISS